MQLHNVLTSAIDLSTFVLEAINGLEIVQKARSAAVELFQRAITFHDQLTAAFYTQKLTSQQLSDKQAALAYNTNLLAVCTLHTIFPAFISITEDPATVLALSSTCHRFYKGRWEEIVQSPTALSILFGKVFFKCAQFENRPLSKKIYEGIVSLFSSRERPSIRNILNLFKENAYQTEITVYLPQLWNYSPDPTELLQLVAKFPRTRTLHLEIDRRFTAAQFQELLDSCHHLVELGVCRELEALDVMWNIKFPKTLQFVHLGDLQLTPVDMNSIKQILRDCRDLNEIHLPGLQYEHGLDFTTVSNTIEMIDLYAAAIDNITLAQVTSSCSQLVDLDLDSCTLITAPGFENAEFPSTLESLNLTNTMIAGDGLRHITTLCTKLQFLSLSQCVWITPEGFLTASFPKTLLSLWLSSTNINDMGLKYILGTCTDLEELSVADCASLTSKAFIDFIPLQLKEVILDRTTVDDEGLYNILKRCSHLEKLHLNNCVHITHEGLAHAPYPKSLKKLFVSWDSLDYPTVKAILEITSEPFHFKISGMTEEEKIQVGSFIEREVKRKLRITT